MKSVLLVFLLTFSVQALGLSNQPYLDMKDPVDIQVATTSVMALAENTYRRYLIVQNLGSASVYIKFGSAHDATEGLVVVSGGNYELLTPPYNSVWLVSTAATQSVIVYEGK